MKTDVELIDAYHNALSNYRAAKGGTGDLAAFTRLLVAEGSLTARLPWQQPRGNSVLPCKVTEAAVKRTRLASRA